MCKLLRVNMTDLSVKTEDIHEDYKGLGGRGLTSAIVAKEVEPTCSPIGPNNKLVFAPGLLGGTNCAGDAACASSLAAINLAAPRRGLSVSAIATTFHCRKKS